jgi:cell division protease FtsH
MRNRYEYELASQTLANTAAEFAIRRNLRRYLRRPGTSFLAVLRVAAHNDLLTYRDAAARLLAAAEKPSAVNSDDTYVAAMRDFERASVLPILRNAAMRRRSVIVTPTFEGLPKEVRLTADLLEDIPLPTAAHFMEAARQLGVWGMSYEYAHYLSQQPFDTIDTVVRKGRPLSNAIARLREQQAIDAAVPEEAPPPDVAKPLTLVELEGYGEVKTWGLELAADIADWKNKKIDWSDIDSGALISGPPGTGKTRFAAALAATCDINLVTASAAKWQAKGHLGDYLKAMRASFETARKQSPCLIFLDEFDSFGDRDGNGDDEHRDYRRQAINGLLECIDGSEGREGIIVVGATNNPDEIDPALLRPGRLERHLQVPMPDPAARASILLQHLKLDLLAGDIAPFVEASNGWTGAQIEKVARNARRIARRRRIPLSAGVVMEALPTLKQLTDEERYRLAVHEAGHAVVGTNLATGMLLQVYIVNHYIEDERKLVLGQAEFSRDLGAMQTAGYYLDRIAVLMGGIAGEIVLLGNHADGAGRSPSSDLGSATDIATTFERQLGFGDTLSFDAGKGRRPLEDLRNRDALLRARVEVILREQLERAIGMLEASRQELEQLALLLVEQGRVSGHVVRQIVANGG